MRAHRLAPLVGALLLPVAAGAQSSPGVPENIRLAVRDVIAAVLPFPAAGDDGTPLDGSAAPRWLVQPAEADAAPLILTFIANPLNAATQDHAARDMAEIQRAVLAAERRAQAEYDSRVATRDRVARRAPMTGVSLDDEGAAGEKADWRAQMIVEVKWAGPEGAFDVSGPDGPRVAADASGAPVLVHIAEREYQADSDHETTTRFRPEEARLFFGLAEVPTVREVAPAVHQVVLGRRGPGQPSTVLEVTLRGNATLVETVLAQATWTRVRDLLASMRTP